MKKIRDADYADLWASYATSKDPEVKARLTEAYFPLVRYIAERIAALHVLPEDAFAALTTANAEHLFGMPPLED